MTLQPTTLAYITHLTLSHPTISHLYASTEKPLLIDMAKTSLLFVAKHCPDLKSVTCAAQQLMCDHRGYDLAVFRRFIEEFAKACHVLIARCWGLEEMVVDWRKSAEWGDVHVRKSLCKGSWKGEMWWTLDVLDVLDEMLRTSGA